MKKAAIIIVIVLSLVLCSCTTSQLAYTSAVLDLTSDVLDIALWPYHWRPLPPPPMHHHRW